MPRRSGVTYKTHLIRLLFEYGYTDGIYKELYGQLFGAGRGRVLHDPAYEPVQAVLETGALHGRRGGAGAPQCIPAVWSLPHSLLHRAPLTA